MTALVPRPEYPRPQMVRENWINLNGEWDFEIDQGKSGRARKLQEASSLQNKIIVPFCPESKLSGIGNKEFMNSVWYTKAFELPEEWTGKHIILHFGAVDYDTEVWINGSSAGTHRGGYTPFAFDITSFVKDGYNRITVCAEDDVRSGLQPSGKQSGQYDSFGCCYTRTTGIWQTVWLECVPETYISSFKLIPDPDNSCIHLSVSMKGFRNKFIMQSTALYKGEIVGESSATVCTGTTQQTLSIAEIHLWEPGAPNLYDLNISLFSEGVCIDKITSYFGLRTVKWNNNSIEINGKPVFQRLVLDQGFYPDGIYTAPTDEDLKKDIEISLGLGFNGARMHEKVFDPRYIYWADKLGYLVWGEFPNWGLDITTPTGLERMLPEWMEAVGRDFNHPAVIGWCPFNETWDNDGRKQDDDVLRLIYNVTKSMDSTRPVIDTSGNFHVVTDIFDIHDYEQDTKIFSERYEAVKASGIPFNGFPERQKYEGQPYFISEYGGIWWNPEDTDNGWGYGTRPKTPEEFIDRYEKLTSALLDNPNICAFCYTQLYNIEQEVNGLYTYNRKSKFDPEIIKKINSRKAAIEK